MIDDPFAEPLVRAVGVDFLTRWATGEHPRRDVDVEGTGWGLQQMPAAMAARTRYFDAFFADAAAAGIRQAVILASGLDARAYRLDWPAGMTVYEIDQPEVIEFKTTTLAGLGAEPKADLRTVAIDLREDWPTALKAPVSTPTQPSAWIAEGLFGYLPPEAQDRLLDAVTELSAPAAGWAARPCRTPRTSTPRRPGDGCASRPPSGASTASDLDFTELDLRRRAQRRRRVPRRPRLDVGRHADGRAVGRPTDSPPSPSPTTTRP